MKANGDEVFRNPFRNAGGYIAGGLRRTLLSTDCNEGKLGVNNDDKANRIKE
jgi:hypothetical protein